MNDSSNEQLDIIIEKITQQIKNIHQEISANKRHTEEVVCIEMECRKEINFVERLVGVCL